MCSGKSIDSILLFKLFRTRVGCENKIYQKITAGLQDVLCFKVLGRYDLLQIHHVKSIEEINVSSQPTEVLEFMSFPCISFNPYTMRYFQKQASTPAACFILLKVNPHILDELPSGSFVTVLEDFSGTIIEQIKEIDLIPFLGMGYYEAILWLPTNNFEKIFTILEFIRNYANGNEKFFIDTMTYPLVSYKQVIEGKKWEQLQGNIRAIVKARCDPPVEDLIPKKIQLDIYDFLGEDDIVYFSDQPEQLSEFIKKLMMFREEFASGQSIRNTSTQLVSIEPIPLTQDASTTSQNQATPELDSEERTCQLIIDRLRRERDADDYVLSLLQQFLSFISCNKHKLLAPKEFSNIKGSLSFLKEKMEEYEQAIRENSAIEKYNIEADLLFFLEALHNALLQKIPGSEFSQAISTSVPVPHTFPVSVILKAIAKIPEFLFSKIKSAEYTGISLPNNATPNVRWKGFVYLDIKEGYRLVNQREIISVPHRHVLAPWHWITLSHEVGHAYFERIKFLISEKDYINHVIDAVDQELDKQRIQQRMDENVWEIFAHWSDFRHFFDGDLTLYFRSIWRTWLEIPRVYEIKTDYWFRCLMIFMANIHPKCEDKIETIYKKHKGNQSLTCEDYKKYFRELLEELEEFIFKNVRMTDPQKANITLSTDDKEIVCETTLRLHHLVPILEKNYINTDLKKKVNSPYEKLKNHIQLLLDGEIVLDEIPNPFLLIREILKHDLENDSPAPKTRDPKIVFAIIYSLSGNTTPNC